MNKRKLLFLILFFFISLSTLSCKGNEIIDFDDYISEEQKFNLIFFEINSIFELLREKFKKKDDADMAHLAYKATLEEIYSQNLNFKFDIMFPPLNFVMEPNPKVLIISPREKIARLEETLLVNNLNNDQMKQIENKIEENTGYSSIIIDIGGLSTYPSLIPSDVESDKIIEILSHEWLHQYLFFFPLGKSYFDNEQMLTVNETLANIFGKEMKKSICMKKKYSKSQICFSKEKKNYDNLFDYPKFMSNLRYRVDAFLLEGFTEKAENEMMEATLTLQSNGYNIRRINQAWFAFYGSYGDSPSSSSDVHKEINEFYLEQKSLGDLIKKLRYVKDLTDYRNLITN